MSKFLITYCYKNNNSIGLARTIVDRNNIDVEKLESELERVPNQSTVIIINVVKISKENICIRLLKKLFKKQIMKLQIKEARRKEFEL